MSTPNKKILTNHKKYKRCFEWRKYKDPYKIMVAEFMLQRTKAEQVEPVYKEFLKIYSDVDLLSNAAIDKIYKFTDQLGLHWRAQHFIKSANFVVNNFNGVFPKNRKDLLKIPGVGNYVAGAILTVCYNKREHVIDSNIARFINRYYGLGLTGEIRRKKIIVEKAKSLFNHKNTRDLLFALLDFTAIICKPRQPACSVCILKRSCKNKT